MSDNDDQDDLPIYEQPIQSGRVRYSYFDRFDKILPPYIWQELIGIQPQKRRAFLIQNRYLSPLTFSYALLEFFVRFAANIIIMNLLRFFWDHFGSDDPITFGLIIVALAIGFGLYRWALSKNTSTIQEEVIFRSSIDLFAVVFSVIVVFNVPQYWKSLFI